MKHQTDEAPFSLKRSFVIQLRHQVKGRPRQYAGRVEHLASMKSRRFDSLDELLTFIDEVLEVSSEESK